MTGCNILQSYVKSGRILPPQTSGFQRPDRAIRGFAVAPAPARGAVAASHPSYPLRVCFYENHRQGKAAAFPRFSLLFFLLFLISKTGPFLPAQAGGISSLAAEIGKAENLPRNPGEKHEALLGLARLFQLSGNLERAAAAWLEAANAAPGGRDDRALLEGCRILIALGEYDKAGEGIKAALAAGREKLRAPYLAALFNAFRGDDRALVRMAGTPDFAPYYSEIYYTLWKISGADNWKTKLLEEFHQSPEGLIAAGAGGVIPAATAHWLLFPGRDASPPPPSPAAPAPQEAAAPRPTASAPASPGSPAPVAAPGPFLQAGLYGREENALAMVERLKKAGFDSFPVYE
jgi:tetratricopeptide (TPR) repeat protein